MSEQEYEKKKVSTSFGLIRHAPTLWNKKKLIQGSSDIALSTDGKKTARLWSQSLAGYGFDLILTSPLERAKKTGLLINESLNLVIHEEPGLREQNWGDFEGKSIKDIRANDKNKLADMEAMGWGFCPPGGESRSQVLNRAINSLENAVSKWPGKNILVITHQGLIKCLLYYLMGRRFLPDESKINIKDKIHFIMQGKDRLAIKKSVNFIKP